MVEGVVYNCELIADTLGKKAVNGRLKSRNVKASKNITLKAVNVSNMPSGKLLMFETNDGYIIGNTFVRTLSQKSPQMNFNSNQQSNQVQSPTKSTVSIKTTDIGSKTKATKNGVLIGGIAGLLLAMKYKQSKLVFAAAGAGLGGYIGGKIKN